MYPVPDNVPSTVPRQSINEFNQTQKSDGQTKQIDTVTAHNVIVNTDGGDNLITEPGSVI